MIDFFKKLPNATQYPIGIEGPILKKIPLIFVIGTLLIIYPAAVIYFKNAVISAAQYKTIYMGALFSYWFFVGVLAIGCVLIMIMKGPGYVADAYELPKEDKSLEGKAK